MLQQNGFFFVQSYFDAGMLYIETNSIIASGVFGQNEIRIKCKNNLCDEGISLLEKTLLLNL